MLRFNDQVSINTSGSLRTLRLRDGWYAVGSGYLVPAQDEEEARDIVRELQESISQNQEGSKDKR